MVLIGMLNGAMGDAAWGDALFGDVFADYGLI